MPLSPPPLSATDQTPVDLTYVVETGPRTELTITGLDVPDSVRRDLAAAWVDVPVDGLLREEFTTRLRPWLAEQGYLQPEIAMDLTTGADGASKTAALTVTPGVKSTERVVVYTGNEALTTEDLDEAMKTAGVGQRIWTSPGDARAVVLAAYRRSGHLLAEVTVGEVRTDGARAELPVRITEGPRFTAGRVTLDGVAVVADVDLKPPIASGAVLTDRSVAEAVRELERRFRRGPVARSTWCSTCCSVSVRDSRRSAWRAPPTRRRRWSSGR
jgi:hypothetical protein